MGTSLWLVPSNTDSLRLQQIMADHPSDCTSPSSFPSFQPHITLAAIPTDPSALSALRAALPSEKYSYPVRFKSIEVGSKYFTSVFLAVHPSLALTTLHAHIHNVLALEPKTPHFPHVSLSYVDGADAPLREVFVEHLEKNGRIVREDGGVKLRFGTEDDAWIGGFEGCEIWIVECDGPVEGWKVLEKHS